MRAQKHLCRKLEGVCMTVSTLVAVVRYFGIYFLSSYAYLLCEHETYVTRTMFTTFLSVFGRHIPEPVCLGKHPFRVTLLFIDS